MTPQDPRETPDDRLTQLLRGLVVREAEAAEAEQGISTVLYFGDYELLEEVGRGGMGVVWRARQRSLDRIVAVKRILDPALATAEARERFRREARAAAGLRHPGIVSVYEIGEHEGTPYFSMEFIEGCDLAQVLREGPVPARRAAAWMREIASAVHHAHAEGVLHRDLKPSNILLDADASPHVTDFGLARIVEDDEPLTRSGDVLGTAEYMAPEQARGDRRRIGRWSDVWSLGAILYELLTGRPPFHEETTFATLRAVTERAPIRPSELEGTVPRNLEAIVLRCLSKEPTRRYATAGELGRDLQRFLDHRPVSVRRTGRLSRAVHWTRRHPFELLLGLLAVVGVLVHFAWFAWVRGDHLRPGASAPASLPDDPFAPFEGFGAFVFLLELAGHNLAWSFHGWQARLRQSTVGIWFLAVTGGIGIVVGARAAGLLTELWVWREISRPVTWAMAYGQVYLGVFLLVRAFHALELRASGPVLPLTQDQQDQLEELLEGGSKRGYRARLARARELYVAWTGADPLFAQHELQRMAADLRLISPDRIPRQVRVVTLVVLLALVLLSRLG